ncbi:MAG TPA: hypothetical protein IAA26_14235 [Candidatus Blautia faecipullorum]|nr:hypothetical protein [Candidatus Blautia faecipullorum]
MLFGKKPGNSLFSQVDDSRQIVYDFRRRTNLLFENYRSVSYRKAVSCELEKLKLDTADTLAKLIAANAVDAGNEDCLVDKILGPVRDGIRYLDDQSLEHMDFYSRQGGNMAVHSADIERILKLWKEKESAMAKEHEHTKMLWDRYCGYNKKEVTKHER